MSTNLKRITRFGNYVLVVIQMVKQTPEAEEKQKAVVGAMTAARTANDLLTELKRRRSDADDGLEVLRHTMKGHAQSGAAIIAVAEPELAKHLPLGPAFIRMEVKAAATAVIDVAKQAKKDVSKAIGEQLATMLEDCAARSREVDGLGAEVLEAEEALGQAVLTFNAVSKAAEHYVRTKAPPDSAARRHMKRYYTNPRRAKEDAEEPTGKDEGQQSKSVAVTTATPATAQEAPPAEGGEKSKAA